MKNKVKQINELLLLVTEDTKKTSSDNLDRLNRVGELLKELVKDGYEIQGPVWLCDLSRTLAAKPFIHEVPKYSLSKTVYSTEDEKDI